MFWGLCWLNQLSNEDKAQGFFHKFKCCYSLLFVILSVVPPVVTRAHWISSLVRYWLSARISSTLADTTIAFIHAWRPAQGDTQLSALLRLHLSSALTGDRTRDPLKVDTLTPWPLLHPFAVDAPFFLPSISDWLSSCAQRPPKMKCPHKGTRSILAFELWIHLAVPWLYHTTKQCSSGLRKSRKWLL